MFAEELYEDTISYLDIIKRAMYVKLHMVRYYSSEMLYHSLHGGAFIKPMVLEFPDDPASIEAVATENVMIGSALKLSINGNPQSYNLNYTSFMFPSGTWCDLFHVYDNNSCFNSTVGAHPIMRTKAYDFYLHLREGHIVPMQDATLLSKTHNISTIEDL